MELVHGFALHHNTRTGLSSSLHDRYSKRFNN
jgi:hypothetical protein